MDFNGISVVPRKNRPSTEDRVKLDLFYIQNGSYVDPYSVSSVTIFKDTTASSAEFPYVTNGLPEKFLDLDANSTNYGLLNSSANDLMVFNFSGNGLLAPSLFTGATNSVSGIYRNKAGIAGQFSVFLVPGASGLNLSGGVISIPSSGLQTGNYFDIWTIQHANGGGVKTYIQSFTLHLNNIIGLAEPVLTKVTTRFEPTKIQYGEKVNLKFINDIVVVNRNISESIKNIFRDSIIQNAAIRIRKANDDPAFANFPEVSGFSDTSGLVEITATDDVLFSFDTAILATLTNNDGFGPIRGVYVVDLKFTLLTETIYSPRFYFTIQ
jgi:hypothetical protein